MNNPDKTNDKDFVTINGYEADNPEPVDVCHFGKDYLDKGRGDIIAAAFTRVLLEAKSKGKELVRFTCPQKR